MPISENQSIGMAILATLFAYDGWILLASIGGEMKNPTKLLPKAMTVGILIVTAAYVLMLGVIKCITSSENCRPWRKCNSDSCRHVTWRIWWENY